MRSSQAVQQFDGEYVVVFAAVCDASRAENMTIRAADRATGTITVSSSVSALSWGENTDIRVWPQDPGTVAVAVQSRLKFGLVDWGRNRRNIERLFARIEQVLRSSHPSVPSITDANPPAPPGWHRDPTARHEFRYWDGGAWTPEVADAGVVGRDPL
jgi:hypothetical protein